MPWWEKISIEGGAREGSECNAVGRSRCAGLAIGNGAMGLVVCNTIVIDIVGNKRDLHGMGDMAFNTTVLRL